MTDPVRWLSAESDADELERAVLGAAGKGNPPAAAQAVVWQNVLGATGALPVLESTPGAGAAAGPAVAPAGGALKALTTATVVKSFIAGVGLGAAVASTAVVLKAPSEPAAPSAMRPVASASAPDPLPRASSSVALQAHDLAATAHIPSALPLQPSSRSAPARAAQSEATVEEPSLSSTAPAETSAQATRASELREEAESIRQARAYLRAGDLTQAFATLEASRTRFRAPVLNQEREALTIELLLRSGRRELALERAQAFERQFPNSPLNAEIQRSVSR